MADIRSFIKSNLLAPFKEYNTIMQDTLLEVITDRLEELYEYTLRFPEIVSPGSGRLDILKTIAEQFLFTLRDEADLQEQIDILDNILYVYNRRGSIDTIENMWKYYGGDLPKDVKVIIPSYNIFRYSISALSGNQVFPNDPTVTGVNGEYRSGVYEIRLTNNTYPVDELRDFMLKELVAAGNRIYFTNTLHTDLTSGAGEDVNPYIQLVYENTIKEVRLEALKSHLGLSLSGLNSLSGTDSSVWSGKGSIYVNIVHVNDLQSIDLSTYKLYNDLGVYVEYYRDVAKVLYNIRLRTNTEVILNTVLHSTTDQSSLYVARYLYNSSGEVVSPTDYSGYFILGQSLLGEVL